MIKCEMRIDDCLYKALFENFDELCEFIADVRAEDGSVVDEINHYEVSAFQILKDKDFEHSYKIEMVGRMLLDNPNRFSKWSDMEDELIALGYSV